MLNSMFCILGKVSFTLILLGILFSVFVYLRSKRYCCKCGQAISGKEPRLYGGCAAYRCSRCSIAFYSRDPFNEDGVVDNIPLRFLDPRPLFLEVSFWGRKFFRGG